MRLLTLSIFSFILLNSCSSDDNSPSAQPIPLTGKVENLHAPQLGGQGEPVSGEFTKFDFATGAVTSSDTQWDIAFRGTSILVNGGAEVGITDEPQRNGEAAAYVAVAAFEEVTEVNTALLKQDSAENLAIAEGSGNGWYTYNSSSFTISPIPGRVLVFRTRDGQHYAKMEILSYYKNAPETIDPFSDEARYYTFNYVFQSAKGDTSF